MYKGKKVSVVMPAWNEADGIYKTVKSFLEQGCVDEVIVADNNSTDATAECARKAGAIIVPEKRQGYGFACQSALRNATGDLIVLTESDDSFYAEDLELFLPYIAYFDMVKGARSNRNLIDKDADWDFPLMFGNWIVAKYMQVLYFGTCFMTDMHMREMGGTFRVITREALQKVLPYLQEEQGAFLPDLTTMMLRHNSRILEIPVRYRRRIGVSKITGNRWKATLLALRMLWVITRNRFRKI